ncbi:YafY family transcriptional regulator [Sphingomonas koreensis]|jgi:predicted DNA-binding transcriptional regulator YafY|uniref:Transcriptional regulator n=1 Tax=Sphingomonas koreensis TaxID=93064 RepID=A0A1L6JAF9_9SPHN|nr:YafY family protein [Sphingomonas koreensis]APR52889.1 transcriptional regulator [Sphingomonas koreensis]MDC7811239.1 YafY family protein [Sphingomonas koreensis]PJI87513.1 WYL domain-containing protein [Sphingomonas koreensis]RSU18084.1 YafY family transcriptional regulator [Sphingomonas koreensis]RSU23396.1 YafY family transcriptional regulator [Sphingomonas koreensis]
MRRADRLFQIIQLLRRHSRPVTADAIAEELETSKRTIYRDIATLMAQRVPIRGEAGIGYVLDSGFDLPPLMLTTDEVEAAVLGAQWVKAQGDRVLARAAEDLLAKLAATVPENLRALILEPVVATPPRWSEQVEPIDMTQLRLWCRRGFKLELSYGDGEGKRSRRTIWPFLIGYRDAVRMVFAWCELRNDFRSFRIDRIEGAAFREERYPDRPAALKSRWIKTQEAKYRS